MQSRSHASASMPYAGALQHLSECLIDGTLGELPSVSGREEGSVGLHRQVELLLVCNPVLAHFPKGQ